MVQLANAQRTQNERAFQISKIKDPTDLDRVRIEDNHRSAVILWTPAKKRSAGCWVVQSSSWDLTCAANCCVDAQISNSMDAWVLNQHAQVVGPSLSWSWVLTSSSGA